MKRTLLSICVFIVTLAAAAVPAGAQQATGTISGLVQDASGAVIPGVTVSLVSPGVIGGNREAVTNERGAYQFTRLVPGAYSVRAELSGFRVAARENIVINADVTLRINLTLEVGEVSDTITVTGEAPLLDTTSALNQAVLDRAMLDKIPTGNDLWSIGRTVPGMILSKYDVGGSESFQQSGMTIHGSPASEKKYAIDGMDVGWTGGNGGASMIYFDTQMFQEVNYQVGNISAENEKGGIVMNMVTKTGTNDFRGAFMFTGSNEGLNFSNLTPELRRDLLAAVPARALAANPNFEPTTKIMSIFDSGLTLSGPIVRDRLWFTSTGKLSSMNRVEAGSYNADNTQAVDDNRIWNASFKTSWQATPNNQLHYTYSRNLTYRYHRRVQTFSDGRASRVQENIADVNQLKWTSTLSSRMVLDAGFSNQWGESRYPPQKEVQHGDVPRIETTTQTLTVAAPVYAIQPNRKVVATASLSYFAGNHDVKFGYQFGHNQYSSNSWSVSHYPSGLVAYYRNGVPESARLYSTPSNLESFFRDHGFYIQDKWMINNKLTLNMGVRVQRSNGWIPEQCQPQGTFVSAQCFDRIADVPNWTDIAPRLSLVYDIFGNGRTALKMSANHYNLSFGMGHVNRVNPLSTATNDVDWTDSNNDRIPQLNELGAGSGFTFGTTNRYEEGIKRPTSDEYSIGLQQELPQGIVLSATYTHRDNWRTIEGTNVATPLSAYDPIRVTIPETGNSVTVYNIKRAFRTARQNVYENRSDLGDYFNGFDLTANKRMTGKWMMMMGLSYNSHLQREGVDNGNPNASSSLFPGGPVSGTVPWTFKLSGAYDLPFGISLSGNVQHFTGKPETQTYRVTRALAPTLTNASVSIPLAQLGTFQLPDTDITDLSVRREFRIGESVRFIPTVDVFNVFNSSAVQGRVTELGPAYHRVTSILAGRLVRFGMNIDF